MQEDKESVFDATETVKKCLSVFAPMVETMKPIPKNMYKAAGQGFINATDLADYLVGKGLPFRSAYKIVGQLVAHCIDLGTVLDELPIEEYKKFDPNLIPISTKQFLLKPASSSAIPSAAAARNPTSDRLSILKSF